MPWLQRRIPKLGKPPIYTLILTQLSLLLSCSGEPPAAPVGCCSQGSRARTRQGKTRLHFSDESNRQSKQHAISRLGRLRCSATLLRRHGNFINHPSNSNALRSTKSCSLRHLPSITHSLPGVGSNSSIYRPGWLTARPDEVTVCSKGAFLALWNPLPEN